MNPNHANHCPEVFIATTRGQYKNTRSALPGSCFGFMLVPREGNQQVVKEESCITHQGAPSLSFPSPSSPVPAYIRRIKPCAQRASSL